MNAIETKHAGIIQVLLEEFEKHRLPVLLKIKDKVDHGNPISEGELGFLEKVFEDADRSMYMMATYPELAEFCQHVVHFYQSICSFSITRGNRSPFGDDIG